MKVLLALVCFMVYCSNAEESQICTTPNQWEGELVRNDFSKGFLEFAKISYDEKEQRFRIIEEIREGKEREFYDTLYLHKTGREYKMNLATKKCNVSDLSRPFRPFGVPPFAKFLFDAEIGAAGIPDEHMMTQTYEAEFENKDKVVVSVTYPDCVPLSSVIFSNGSANVRTDFNSITLGISDPEIFTPPSECN